MTGVVIGDESDWVGDRHGVGGRVEVEMNL